MDQNKKIKTTSSDPWRGTQKRLDRGHRSELCVFLFLVACAQTNQNQKTKSSDPWGATQERLDRRHRSEVFCFWSLLGRPTKTKKQRKKRKFRPMERDPPEHFASFGQTSQNPPKKVQTHGEGLRRGWTGDIGLNFLSFCFW